jgi:ankyrin repeat protein
LQLSPRALVLPHTLFVLIYPQEIDARDKDGRTALMWASFMGHIHCVRTLIVMGASVNLVEEESGKTGEVLAKKGSHPL